MNFSITQILREIRFWDSRREKSSILTLLKALTFDCNEFKHSLKAEIAKMAVFKPLHSPKLISRKI